MPDKEYMDWLCQYHPDDVLNHTSTFIGSDNCDNTLQAGSSSDVNLSSQTDSDNDYVSPICSDSDHTSVPDALSGIPITTPVAITSESNDAFSVAGHHSEVLSALQQEENMPNNERAESITRVSKPDMAEKGELRYISKYLVQFVPNAKPKNKEEVVRISGARVLISDRCAAILKEREEKKQKEKEKERRKLIREQKELEREEEQKKRKAAAAEKRAAAAERRVTKEAEKKTIAEAKRAAAEVKKIAEKQAERPVDDELSRKRQAASYTT